MYFYIPVTARYLIFSLLIVTGMKITIYSIYFRMQCGRVYPFVSTIVSTYSTLSNMTPVNYARVTLSDGKCYGIFVLTFIFLQTVAPGKVSVWSDEQPHNYTTNLPQLYNVIKKWRELFETYTSEDKMSR